MLSIGNQTFLLGQLAEFDWIPASAGMTIWGVSSFNLIII
jgi:hypothetical protein